MNKRIQHSTNILATTQYLLAIIIAVLIFIGLIPLLYNEVYQSVVLLLIIQLLISVLRGRPINAIFEMIMVISLSIAALPLFITVKIVAIPLSIVLYIFKIIAAIIAILDISAQNSIYVYRKFEMNRNQNQKPKENKKRFEADNIEDAEFKEK